MLKKLQELWRERGGMERVEVWVHPNQLARGNQLRRDVGWNVPCRVVAWNEDNFSPHPPGEDTALVFEIYRHTTVGSQVTFKDLVA